MKKILYILIFFFVFQAGYAEAKENNFIQKARIQSKSLQKICNNSKSTFLITYPQVEKLKFKYLENKINLYLKKEFSKFKNGNCEDDNNESYKEVVSYDVKMNNKGILSIYYKNSGYSPGTAHPNNVSGGYNLSLNTGNPIEFKNLFKKDINFLNKINFHIKKSLEKQNIELEFEDKTNFDFYLTYKQLVIINLFDFHALQSVEAPIDYSDIINIIDKDGPLKTLFKK